MSLNFISSLFVTGNIECEKTEIESERVDSAISSLHDEGSFTYMPRENQKNSFKHRNKKLSVQQNFCAIWVIIYLMVVIAEVNISLITLNTLVKLIVDYRFYPTTCFVKNTNDGKSYLH